MCCDNTDISRIKFKMMRSISMTIRACKNLGLSEGIVNLWISPIEEPVVVEVVSADSSVLVDASADVDASASPFATIASAVAMALATTFVTASATV